MLSNAPALEAAILPVAMNFAEMIYPHRNNRTVLPQRLLRDVDCAFTRLEGPQIESQHTEMHRLRCGVHSSGGERVTVCNRVPTEFDKRVVRVLLRAWLRQGISDRYLDRFTIEQLHRHAISDTEVAYDLIRQNYPRGAVMFIYNEIPRNGALFELGAFPPAKLLQVMEAVDWCGFGRRVAYPFALG